jgi:molecular chaperone GrpE
MTTPPNERNNPGNEGETDAAADAVTADIQDAFAPAQTGAAPEGAGQGESRTGEAAAEGREGVANVEAWGDSQAVLEDLQARYTRLSADFDNFRRRTAREALDRARYAAEDVARALLPVLDNLQRAVDHAPAGANEEYIDGLRHTVRQFEDALASVGVVPIEAEGKPFDPNLHEAVTGEESENVDVDTVVSDLRRGYRLHDRVLRPSIVKVAHPLHAATEA